MWVAVWLTLALTGHPYSYRALYAGWQFLPVEPLAADPLGSVWHLHIQPPLWNLLVGGIDAWSPLGVRWSHRLVSLGSGACLAAAVCATLGRLGAGARLALALTAVATLNTQVLAHAFEPRYDLAVTALLASLVWAVARIGVGPGWFFVVSLVGTVLVSIRALYHPAWLLVTLGVVAWAGRSRLDVRRLAVAALLPVVFVGGWIVKNEVVFDRPSMSSWTGMNLLRSMLPAVDADRLQELADDGVISGVALAGSFRALDAYEPVMPPCDPGPDADPVLTIRTRVIPDAVRVGGVFDRPDAVNFNHECFLPIFDQAGDDALALVRAEPGAWVTARLWSVNNWPEVYDGRPPGSSPLWNPLAWATAVVMVAIPHPGIPASWEEQGFWVQDANWSLVWLLAAGALCVAGVRSARGVLGRRGGRAGPAAADTPAGASGERAETTAAETTEAGSMDAGTAGAGSMEAGTAGGGLVHVVGAWIVVWTTGVGVVAELGEQVRFRSAIDPIVLGVGGLLIVRSIERRRDARRAAPARTARWRTRRRAVS